MNLRLTTPIVLALCLTTAVVEGQTSTTQVATGFNQPVFATAAPGDFERLFFLEQYTGNVRVLDLTTGEVQADPYLRVTNLSTGGERGLLGLAFHPDFATNGQLYVYASQRGGPRSHQSQVFEYTANDPLNDNVVESSTQRSILRFDQPFGNHNGGWIGFNPTASGEDRNHLYVATGDGGAANDPENNSQDITDNLLGKLLRLDISGDDFLSSDVQNYSIPASNPFANTTGDGEIFSYGLRNPWRASFDSETGDIWIGDVGQGEVEEIDVIPAGTSGQNFGWRVMEGTDCFNSGDARDGNVSCDDDSLTPPVYEYRHDQSDFGGFSVTGGYLYRGPVKEFQGQYVFADFASGHIWTQDPDSGVVLNRNDELHADQGDVNRGIASFGEDASGNLYIVTYGNLTNATGSVYRVTSSSRDAVWDGSQPTGSVGDNVSWMQASNWSRDSQVDVAFEQGDHLIVRNASLQSQDPRTFSALTLEEGILSLSNRTEIVSGNITVPNNSTGNIIVRGDGVLEGRAQVIRKLGGGNLFVSLDRDMDAMLAVHDGNLQLGGGNFSSLKVAGGGRLDVQNVVLDDISLAIEKGGTLDLDFNNGDGSTMSSPHTVTSLDNEGTITIIRPIDDEFTAILREGPLTILSAGNIEALGELQLLDVSTGPTLLDLQMGGRTVVPQWDSTGDEANLTLSLLLGIKGDANLDGIVDFADFLIQANNFGKGSTNGWLDGDFSGHGIVAFSDFLELTGNFGRTGYRSLPAAASVPEPNGWLLMMFSLATIGLLLRGKRVRR